MAVYDIFLQSQMNRCRDFSFSYFASSTSSKKQVVYSPFNLIMHLLGMNLMVSFFPSDIVFALFGRTEIRLLFGILFTLGIISTWLINTSIQQIIEWIFGQVPNDQILL